MGISGPSNTGADPAQEPDGHGMRARVRTRRGQYSRDRRPTTPAGTCQDRRNPGDGGGEVGPHGPWELEEAEAGDPRGPTRRRVDRRTHGPRRYGTRWIVGNRPAGFGPAGFGPAGFGPAGFGPAGFGRVVRRTDPRHPRLAQSRPQPGAGRGSPGPRRS